MAVLFTGHPPQQHQRLLKDGKSDVCPSHREQEDRVKMSPSQLWILFKRCCINPLKLPA